MRILMISLLWIVCSGTGTLSIAAEKTAGSADEPVVESPSELAQRERRLLPSLLGSTLEERERLKEERKHLSEEAKAFGTDPTAIVGYYQLNYGHSTFTNNLRLDTTTATVVLPITPNWLFRVNMPYVWADLNQPHGFTTNGTSDMTIRTGGRIYSSDSLALFVGTDASFPTGSNDRLSTGKYILGPGAALAVPLARVHSLFFLLVQDFNSIGGDPSRANLHFAQVQSSLNTI